MTEKIFYKSIAKYYDHIFPFKKPQLEFIKRLIKAGKQLEILDIGCATGALAVALSQDGQKVTGIDLDEGLLEFAKKRESKNTNFLLLDMFKITEQFKPLSFDGALCFGNTLSHHSPELRITFFNKLFSILKKDSFFTGQIVNYDRILKTKDFNLPPIDNEVINFKRTYKNYKNDKPFNFDTELHIKKTSKKITNSITLYPIYKDMLFKELNEAGFTNISFFGSFKQDTVSSSSFPLIFTAQK